MDAKELRIGNHLLCDGNLITVTYHHIRIQSFADAGHVSSITNEKFKGYEPIPLTEEWLLKFGFEKFIHGLYGSSLKDNYVLGGINISHYLGEFVFHGTVKIKYVHQLQNLYFALTGEELKLQQNG